MLHEDTSIIFFNTGSYIYILAWSFPWNEIILELALSTDDLINWTFFQFIIEQANQNFVKFIEQIILELKRNKNLDKAFT